MTTPGQRTAFVHDNWSWLNRWIGDGIAPPPRPLGVTPYPSWVPGEDQRRLAAYTVCAAFLDNVARYWQPYFEDQIQRDKWREYGDPELFTVQARSGVLGESQTINVTVPLIDQDPQNEDGQGEPADKPDAIPDPAAQAVKDWLVDWADQESLTTRLLDAEHDAMGLGDALYVLATDPATQRPKLRVYDPGWYFPDPTSQRNDEDFPRTVHLAWEELKPGTTTEFLLRRRTWKLVDFADPAVFPEGAPPAPTYPWSTEPATQTVFYWDGTWDLGQVAGANGLYDLSSQAATWTAEGVDLQLDFIPVVHIPNGSPGKALWGRPVWWSVIRLLDDIAASDTDAQHGSEIYGSGALLDKGTGIPGTASGPGAVYRGTETSDAKFIDQSAGMKAMTEFKSDQRDLASVNARLPAEVLGRVKASEVPSGVPFRLAMGPYSSLVRELRLIRDDKYGLVLKFAMRLGQRLGVVAAGVLPVAKLKFGSYLPSDQAEAVTTVTELWDRPNPVISLQTAVQILVDAGFPIDDAVEEVKRINRQAFQRAVLLLDATGDEQAVRDLLNTGELPKLDDAPSNLPLPIVVPPLLKPPDPTQPEPPAEEQPT